MSESQGLVGGSQHSGSVQGGAGALWTSAMPGPGGTAVDLIGSGSGAATSVAGEGGAGSPQSSRGPFNPAVNGLLRSCFGHVIDDISVTRAEGEKNRSIAADAHTIGKRISLGDKIKEDPGDLHSMEVIAHEVAHALAGGGAGKHILNRPGDAGETAAYESGRGFKNFIAGGGRGPAPQLKPALGGQAVIHRWESGEHVRAVDNAVDVLDAEKRAGRTDGVQVSDEVKQQMKRTITLENGVELTPGQITALMGDFYGRFDAKGNFDPKASFEQLNTADEKEMRKLLGAIDNEVTKHETASNLTLEEATKDRQKKKNQDGSVDLTYLQLAQKNNSHFSADNMTDPNNNMGAYSMFHEMALREAQKGDEKSIERARAMEACGMHYLTDRHSAGHNVDKNGLMDASGYERDSYTANAYVKTIHDDLNKNGITVQSNDKNANDKEWRAYGDDHWDDDGNKENRYRTAKSVYTSYSELEAVISKKKTADQIINKDGFGAKDTVPKFSKERQEGLETTARNLDPASAWWKGLIKGGIGDGTKYAGEKISNGWNWVKDTAGGVWDWTKKTATDGYDWAAEKVDQGLDWGKEKAGQAVDFTKKTVTDGYDWAAEKVDQGLDWGKEKAGQAVDFTKKTASDGYDWGQKKLNQGIDWTKKTASDGYDWGQKKLNQGVDWTKKTASDGYDWGEKKVNQGIDWTKKTASDAWDGTKKAASDGYDWGEKKVNQGIDWTKKTASDAWDGTKKTASQTWEGAKDLGHSVVNTAGSAVDGAKNAASSGWNWIKKQASRL